MSKEEWKTIQDFPNYEISNYGNVRKNKVIMTATNDNGYKVICLYNNGKRKKIGIHILVAKYFVDGYKKGLVVNHKDENRANNYFENLEWLTRGGNVQYSLSRPVKSIDDNGNETHYKSISETRYYGYSYGDVQRACETKIKHKGLRWEYV